MTVLTEGRYETDVLKWEALNDFSRDTGVIKSGAGILDIGTVLGLETATGKYLPATTNDTPAGTGQARAVLLRKIDATSADVQVKILKRGNAKVGSNMLIFGSTFTTQSQRDAAVAQLEANCGIIARRQA